ncbi:hypothetical protein CIRMBP1294_00380 [Enterococcus cecorum]|nr:hypothetical protein CIRMBP1294_00380 [Enterococcus cecorum]
MSLKLSKNFISNIYYCAWIMMVVHLCVANSNANLYSAPFISYIAIIMFALKILLQRKFSLINLLLLPMMLFIGYECLIHTDDMRVLWFFIAILASKDIDFEKLIKLTFRTMLICCICFFTLFLLGVIDQTVVNSVRGIRQSLGLGHPNMFSAYYSILLTLGIYIKFDKLSIVKLFFLMIGSFIVYSFTKSFSGIITCMCVILIVIILKYVPLRNINSRLIIIFLLIGMTVFTLAPILFNEKLLVFDKIVTGRIHQAHFYYKKYGIDLFGNNVNKDLNSPFTDNILDIGYTKMLLNNGLIYYLIVVCGYIFSLFRSLEFKNKRMIVLMSGFIIYMFTENVATYVFMNPSMIYFSKYLFEFTGKRVKYFGKKHEKNS